MSAGTMFSTRSVDVTDTGKTQVFKWFSRFKSGEMSIDDQARSGRPSTAQTNGNVKIYLGMRRVAAKFVPRLLTEQQKQGRVESCSSLKEEFQNNTNFFSKVITGDESWCYEYDPENKQQLSQWKSPASPRSKKARQVRGVKRLKRPDLWQSGDWFFHHDNAPAHTTLSVRRFLTKNDMTTVSHPPYSPDLFPCVFFLFPRKKMNMKGKRFVDIDKVKKKKTTEALAGITKDEIKKCLKNWNKRLAKCINSNGEYFEGD
ncbi:Hypothetical protein CINCED_3A009587 [Cinara cedri]|uniref:Mos1 transposase HTH domain-containing protein n=1 Tax=Cinara cedri TaxID=506608 RepID=A0A5E4M3H9_9HEMI|nr:Hypothetical protein CINCED_3A009587 [Cinara cedri]